MHTKEGRKWCPAGNSISQLLCCSVSEWPRDQFPSGSVTVKAMCANSRSDVVKESSCLSFPCVGWMQMCKTRWDKHSGLMEQNGRKHAGFMEQCHLPARCRRPAKKCSPQRNKQSHLNSGISQCLCDSSLACVLTNACDFLLPQLCTESWGRASSH